MSWLEFFTDQTLATSLSDKIAVRNYVSKKGLEQILVPQIGSPWVHSSDISLAGMPKKFVIKAAHGSGMNLICQDKSAISERHVRQVVSGWLRHDYARAPLEPHYLAIPRRAYCEEFIDAPGGIVDYKIHCFDGVPHFVLVTSERDQLLKLNLYDLNWERMAGLQPHIAQAPHVPKPTNLRRMLEVAAILSAGLPFARIDLYDAGGRVLFGEITFSPAGGIFAYFTDQMLEDYGRLIELT